MKKNFKFEEPHKNQGRYFQDNLGTSYIDYSCRFNLLPVADIFRTTYELLMMIIHAGSTYFQGQYFQNNLQTSYNHYSCKVNLLPGPIFSGQLTNFL